MNKIKKPKRIIMILSDDQGYWSLGSYGNQEVKTPNLDELAFNGARFDNFFCVSPVCSPARASILTGKIPSQHGVHDWIEFKTENQRNIEYLENQKTYVDILAENGYICGLSGKWHLGASHKVQHGFQHWFCHIGGGGTYYGAQMHRDGKLTIEKDYITDVITDDAIDFIKQNKDIPFYLHIGYTAPHSPWLNNHPKKYTDMYRTCQFNSVPQLTKENLHPNRIKLTDDVLKNERENLIGYYAAVTAMDDNIGRIISTLDELNLRQDTLLLFMSDNGFNCGHHGFWGKGNGTFPLNLYDESVKVPFIMNYPDEINARIVKNNISGYDIFPTMLDLIESDQNEKDNLPGNSFLSVLRNDAVEDNEKNNKVVIFDEYGPNRMIRTDKYKLIKRYPYGPDEFYDLINDPEEKNNQIENINFETAICSLSKELCDWFHKYVNCEIDGVKERVWGAGQQNLAGKWSDGKSSYLIDDSVLWRLKKSNRE